MELGLDSGPGDFRITNLQMKELRHHGRYCPLDHVLHVSKDGPCSAWRLCLLCLVWCSAHCRVSANIWMKTLIYYCMPATRNTGMSQSCFCPSRPLSPSQGRWTSKWEDDKGLKRCRRNLGTVYRPCHILLTLLSPSGDSEVPDGASVFIHLFILVWHRPRYSTELRTGVK